MRELFLLHPVYLTTILMSGADDNLWIKKNSSKVKIVYIIINKFTSVSAEYDFPLMDTEIRICTENRKAVEKLFTKGVNT